MLSLGDDLRKCRIEGLSDERDFGTGDRAAGFAALNASASELALLARDINHLTHLLSKGSVAAAREYRGRLDSLEGDVRKHLELSAAVIAELMADRRGRAWVADRKSSLIGSRP